MPGPLKCEAVVLRSMRFGEADRILHLYTPHRGRVGAIAKGVRRTRSRFGGRLEPFFRVRLDLHEGRSDLLTITGAETVAAYPRLRTDAAAIDAAPRARARMRPPSPPPPAPATPCRPSSRTPSRTRRSSTCCATSWRCSTTT